MDYEHYIINKLSRVPPTGIPHSVRLPDHSSGADRRGWVLAKDARDDAWRLLQEHAQRIGPNVRGEA